MDLREDFRTRLQVVYEDNKKTFLGLYLYCIVLYLPLIVLRLTNSMDGMWDQDDHVTGAAELRIGRWFWPYLDKLRLNISLDPFPALVSLALFVLGMLLVLSTLQLKKSWITCGAAVLFLSSPAALCQLSYSYMSITFSTGFVLAVLAVWMLAGDPGRKRPDGEAMQCLQESGKNHSYHRHILQIIVNPRILLSVVLIAVMMGCYQAFLGVTCVLALFVFILLVKRNESLNKAFTFVLQMLIALAVGAVLYEILLHANLAYYGETMSDYNGADAITFTGVLKNLPSSIKHTYVSFLYYYGNSGSRFHALQGKSWFPVFYVVPALGAVLLVLQVIRKENTEKRFLRGGLILVALLLIPVFANSFFLLASSAETQMQMTGGLALSLPLVLCLWEEVLRPQNAGIAADGSSAADDKKEQRIEAGEESGESGKISEHATEKVTAKVPRRKQVLKTVCVVGIAALLYGAAGQAATDEYAMYVGRQATTTLARNILNQFTNAGTDYTEQVVMVYGQPAQSPLFEQTELYQKANFYAQYGNWSSGTEANRLCWSNFYGQQLRVNVNYAEGDTLETIYNSPEVAAMPVYPAAGSTANVWGVTVVKISE